MKGSVIKEEPSNPKPVKKETEALRDMRAVTIPVRCQKCEACRSQDCGMCRACKNRNKFGGDYHLCLNRICSNMTVLKPNRSGRSEVEFSEDDLAYWKEFELSNEAKI